MSSSGSNGPSRRFVLGALAALPALPGLLDATAAEAQTGPPLASWNAPALAEPAMEGRLPRGFCIKRLTDLPMLWSEQWGAIGLLAPAQVRAEPR